MDICIEYGISYSLLFFSCSVETPKELWNEQAGRALHHDVTSDGLALPGQWSLGLEMFEKELELGAGWQVGFGAVVYVMSTKNYIYIYICIYIYYIYILYIYI